MSCPRCNAEPDRELDGVTTEASARVSAGAGLSAAASVDEVSDLPEGLDLLLKRFLATTCTSRLRRSRSWRVW